MRQRRCNPPFLPQFPFFIRNKWWSNHPPPSKYCLSVDGYKRGARMSYPMISVSLIPWTLLPSKKTFPRPVSRWGRWLPLSSSSSCSLSLPPLDKIVVSWIFNRIWLINEDKGCLLIKHDFSLLFVMFAHVFPKRMRNWASTSSSH